MENTPFIQWLTDLLTDDGHVPSCPEDLSDEESTLARGIRERIKQTWALTDHAGIYLQALSGTEKFYDMSIRALSALIKVGRISGEIKDIYTLCRKSLEIFSQELEFENCSIMMKDSDNEHLVLMAGKGKGDSYSTRHWEKGRRIKIGEGIAGKAAETGNFIFIADVAADERYKKISMSVEVTSLLSIPLKNDDEVIGVINFSHPLLEAFDENKINLMVLLSNFVGQMIMLADLHNKIAHWNESLRRQVNEKTAELRKKNRELQRMAVKDPLTGIYNRRFFSTRLEEEFIRACRYNEHFSLLLIDLDNLKPINDTFGHLTGDRVIKGLTRTLKAVGRTGDVIARIGGDEFAYILLESSEIEAKEFEQRIHEKFEEMNFRGINHNPTVSIGIAHSSKKKFKKHMEIYKLADENLYRAKKKKKIV